MTLLIGAGLMGRTLLALSAEPLGFDPDRVVKANLLLPLGQYADAAARRAGVERLLDGIARIPGVHDVAVASPHPFRPMGQLPVLPEGQGVAGSLAPRARQFVVTPGYFGLLRIPLKSGRLFAHEDAQSPPAAVVSEALARALWPEQNPIDRRLRIGNDTVWRTVVGVVGDVREPLEVEQGPEVYLPYAQLPRAYVGVLARMSVDETSAAQALRHAAGRVDDVLALADVEQLSDVVARDSRRHRALAVVLSTFGLLALGIAMLGLYATLAYVVAQRRREIAIRVAVGADPSRITRLVLREGGLLVAIGVIAGAAASIALVRALATQLYGVAGLDPVTFVGTALLLALAALGATVSPAWQALRVQPAETLRSD